MRALARDGYGWSEFIEPRRHRCRRLQRFFRRAGAWLALLHCFAAADMHQENMIASGERPGADRSGNDLSHGRRSTDVRSPEEQAADAARDILANSVMAVGLLPAYGRSPFNNVFAIGGLTADWTVKNRHRLDQRQHRRDAAGEGEAGRRRQSKFAAC